MKFLKIRPVTKVVCAGKKNTNCSKHINKDNLQDTVGENADYCDECQGQEVEQIRTWNYSAIAIYTIVLASLIYGILSLLPGFLSSSVQIPIQPEGTPTETPNPNSTEIPNTLKPEEQEKLKQAEDFAKIAADNMNKPQNITSLEQAKSSFEKAIEILETIPSDPTVQEPLASYKADVTELEKRIAEEQKAQALLNEAKSISEKATQELDQFGKDGFRRISVLNRIKNQLQNALGKVNIISTDYPNSLAFAEAKTLIENYEGKIGRIDNEIFEIRKKCPSGDGIDRLGSCLP